MFKTNNDRKDRLKWLEERQKDLLLSTAVQLYLKWQVLPDQKKNELVARWRGYYLKVKQTPSFLNYIKCKDAWKTKNWNEVKKYADVATEMSRQGNYLDTPSTIDPRDFQYDHRCQDYDKVTEEMSKLRRTVRLSPEEIFH